MEMTDVDVVAEQLRDLVPAGGLRKRGQVILHAAAILQQQASALREMTADRDRLAKALEPFVTTIRKCLADDALAVIEFDYEPDSMKRRVPLTVGDLRRAAAALSPTPDRTEDAKPDWPPPPASKMTVAEITAELVRLEKKWAEMRADEEGHGGSPGEWIYERIDELDTELKLRSSTEEAKI
jgi:hypothetical protein